MNDETGFFEGLIGDGRSLLVVTALVLIGAGAFTIFQATTGHFLPHDTEFLGMTSQQLCSMHACKIVHFMVHDRISFGGVLLAIGVMYLWLAQFPLQRGESWAWWAFAISGIGGFLSFLAYLGYGYLDTWHGAATMVLLPIFLGGLAMTRRLRTTRITRAPLDLRSRRGLGRAMLLASTLGIVFAGLTIMTVGMTAVFVPQDLEFMGLAVADLQAINGRLIPLIAHDRAGFGGALVSCGLAMFVAVAYGTLSRNLLQALGLAGLAGFVTAIGVHPAIGYTSLLHLGPAIVGCIVYFTGLALTALPDRSPAVVTA